MSSIADAQATALVARLIEQARRACEDIAAEARATSADIVRDARRAGRARLHAAVAEKRRRVAAACRAADIECEATQRSALLAAHAALANQAFATLPCALAERWQQAGPRRRWWCEALGVAARVLTDRHWSIDLAPGLAADEQQDILAEAVRLGAINPVLSESPVTQGLRITSGGATTVDATAAGLLADATSLRAELLAEITAQASAP